MTTSTNIKRLFVLGLTMMIWSSLSAQQVYAYDRKDTTTVGWRLTRVWKDGRCGLIDRQGNIVVPVKYDTIANYRNKRAAVVLDNHVGFIDPAGRLVVPLEDNYMSKKGELIRRYEGSYSGGVNGGKVGRGILTYKEYIDYDLPRFVHPNAALVKKGQTYFLIDSIGQRVSNIYYTKMSYLHIESGPTHDQSQMVVTDTLFYCGGGIMLNPSGGYVLPNSNVNKNLFYKNPILKKFPELELRYESINQLSRENGMTDVTNNKLVGLIDKYGHEIVPPIYNKIGSFNFGLASVLLDGKQGFIDTLGHVVIPLKYNYGKGRVKPTKDHPWRIASMPRFHNDKVAIVLHNDKWGMIDKSGNSLTNFKYVTLKEDGDSTLFRGILGKGSKQKTVYLDSYGNEFPTRESRTKALSAGSYIPTIDWIDFTTQTLSSTWQLTLGIRSATPVEEVKVTVNGQRVNDIARGVAQVHQQNYDVQPTQTLSLNVGENVVRVEVRNASGNAFSERTITRLQPTKKNSDRLALVIGNSSYVDNIGQLTNPQHDADSLASKLRSLGFDVMTVFNASRNNMREKINEFGNRARDYNTAFFYFAGHGLQVQDKSGGTNYLVPVDADEIDYDDDVIDRCISANTVINKLCEAQCKTKIVIFDACRSNPLKRSWQNAVGGEGGLLTMDAPEGTLITYATSPGKAALDGNGNNSPFAEALFESIDKKGVDIELCFKNVRQKVKNKTQSRQIPWTVSSLTDDFYFVP